jgi:hypothetical protein
MKEAVNFLRHVFDGSVCDVANIMTAEAEDDKITILSYLTTVREYTQSLIEIVKNNE